MRFAVIANQAFALINFRGRLLRDAAASGATVFALAPDFTDSDRQEIAALGARAIDFPLSRTGMNPVRDLRTFFALRRRLRELRPDAVLSVTLKPAIYGTLAGVAAAVPRRFALITGLGYAFTGEGRTRRQRIAALAARFLGRVALRRAHGLFVQNPDDAAELVRLRIADRAQIKGIFGTGVDLGAWPVVPAVHTPMTFTLVGRILSDKGVREFVEAARRVRPNHPNARFVLVGDVDSNPTAIPEAEIRKWVEEGTIIWTGHVPVRPWLEQTSVFVLPSYREGLPRSTQEAMAMARPVITTDAPGCRETVVEGRNGFLVPVGDSAALADAMRRFFANPELVETMGRESRNIAEERFDVAKINRSLLVAMGLAGDTFRGDATGKSL